MNPKRHKEVRVGLWIDHKKAVIVNVNNDNKAVLTELLSELETQGHLSDGSQSPNPDSHQGYVPESRYDEKHNNQMKYFFHNVLKKLHNADKIFLMGPGEVKLELKNVIEKEKVMTSAEITVEKKDKLTDNQIIAEVKKFFECSLKPE